LSSFVNYIAKVRREREGESSPILFHSGRIRCSSDIEDVFDAKKLGTIQDTWTLTLRNVQTEDRGPYMCQVNSTPVRKQVWHFLKEFAPFIVNLIKV
jgi:hypothetical protein